MTQQPTFDIAELYPRLDASLRKVVHANLDVPDCVVDDACQVAWTLLITDPPPVGEQQVLGWLATTARREVLLMQRRSAIELRLVQDRLPDPELETEDPQESAEFWDRLGQIRRLNRRQQRIVWMLGLGYNHAEIAEETGVTIRTVERQLIFARRRLDSVA